MQEGGRACAGKRQDRCRKELGCVQEKGIADAERGQEGQMEGRVYGV